MRELGLADLTLARVATSEVLRWRQLAAAAGPLREAVLSGTLSLGHARFLLPLDQGEQATWAREASREGWSVRRLRRALREGRGGREESYATLERDLGAALATAVQLRWPGEGPRALQ